MPKATLDIQRDGKEEQENSSCRCLTVKTNWIRKTGDASPAQRQRHDRHDMTNNSGKCINSRRAYWVLL